jgi:transposase
MQVLNRTCGAPGARKRARRVREAVRGNGPVDKAGTAPRIDFTTHISTAMRAFIEAHPDWLTEARLPAYAPDLNAVEGAWANMKNGLGNLAAADVDQLTAIIKNRLKSIQYRPALIDGFLSQTGLTLEPEPP